MGEARHVIDAKLLLPHTVLLTQYYLSMRICICYINTTGRGIITILPGLLLSKKNELFLRPGKRKKLPSYFGRLLQRGAQTFPRHSRSYVYYGSQGWEIVHKR